MKDTIGTWEGISEHDGKKDKATITYKLTSGGSAIVENLFQNTPHEMVSVYHDDGGGKLMMTHYCALGNQPDLRIKNASDNKLEFEYISGSDIIPEKDAHMHSLTITFLNKDNMVHEWKMFNDGKEKSVTVIDLKRIK